MEKKGSREMLLFLIFIPAINLSVGLKFLRKKFEVLNKLKIPRDVTLKTR